MIDHPAAAAPLRVWFVRMALAAAALTAVVIVASALMRHAQAGLACADWPACYGRLEGPAADAPRSTGVRLARLAHRLAATGVLALVIGMVLVAWTQRPAWRREGWLALAALLVTGALAVLGIATPGTRIPAVTLGNLLGGYLMLALLAAIAAAAMPDRHDVAPSTTTLAAPRLLAAVLLALVFVQTASGGMIGAQYALAACPALQCGDVAAGPVSAMGAFDPFRTVVVESGRVLPPTNARDLHVVHRALGLAIAAFALVVAWRLRAASPATARVIAVLALVAPLLGIAAVLAMPSLPLTILHNAATAGLVALLAYCIARCTSLTSHGRV